MTKDLNKQVADALAAEEDKQNRLGLRYLVVAKQMNRQDHIDAVEALGPKSEWSEIDQMIFAAHKLTGKPYAELMDASLGELEEALLA